MNRADTKTSRYTRWLGPICCAVAFLAMLALSWQTWADPIVDFGRELYVPWRLSEGEKLYRDVQYFSGPVSPYINSIFIQIFGLKLMTLGSVNLVLFAGLCAALYWLGVRLSDRVSATFATIAVIVTCGFGRLTQTANFNFVMPYSHEMTHSIVLSIIALVMMDYWMRTGRRIWMVAIGASVGMTMLMKPEVFVAIFGAAACGMLLSSRRARLKDVGLLVASFLAVPALILLLSSDRISSLGAIRFVTNEQISALPYYRIVMGLDNVRTNLELAISRASYLLATGGLLWFIARHQRVRLGRAAEVLLGLSLGAACLVASAIIWGSIRDAIVSVWRLMPAAFTFLMPLATIAFCLRAFQARRTNTDHRPALFAMLCVFATLLLAKIAFRVSFQHYGFALALPTLFVFGIISIGWLPQSIERSGGSRSLFHIGAIGVFSALVTAHLYMTLGRISELTLSIQSPVGTLKVDPELTLNQDVKRVLDELPRIAQPDDTLAIVPEGAMLNVLSLRKNPTGAIVTMPVELIMFGEDDVLARFEKNPPDWLVIRVASMEHEYAARGIEYMPKVRRFLAENYEPIEPERANGLHIYRKR